MSDFLAKVGLYFLGAGLPWIGVWMLSKSMAISIRAAFRNSVVSVD